MKKESRKKADVISKLRTGIAKAQYTLKKNGVLESEVSCLILCFSLMLSVVLIIDGDHNTFRLFSSPIK